MACRIFDPFVLKETPIVALNLIADDLCWFEQRSGEPVFSQQFIRLLKTEIPLAKEHAMKEFDWDSIPDSKSYRDRSHRRKLMKELHKEMARVRDDIEQERVRAEANIQSERDAAIEDLRKEFAGLAISAAEKVVRTSLDEDGHKELIESVLEESTSGNN